MNSEGIKTYTVFYSATVLETNTVSVNTYVAN